MVITRRAPPTMPPTSRQNSSQTANKFNKGKAPQASPFDQDLRPTPENEYSGQEIDLTAPQFQDDVFFSDGSPPRKLSRSKSKGKMVSQEVKQKAKRRKRSKSWLDFFSRLFLLSFLIYSLSVCPNADKEKKPVCRALSEYRRLVLEPYVVTPFQNLLHHPSVSPYATPIIENSKPIIARTCHEWNSRIVPQWNARVIPFWVNKVAPQWQAHISPQVDKLTAKVEPYQKAYEDAYYKHVYPYAKRIQDGGRKVQPYVLLAATKTYDSYQVSKPFLSKGVAGAQKMLPFINEYIVKPLAIARRQFVDPHVALLVEKIKELSSGKAKVSTGTPVETEPSPSPMGAANPTEISETTGTESTVALPTDNVPVATSSRETDSVQPAVNTGSTMKSASSILADSVHMPQESVPGATYSPSTPAASEKPVAAVAEPLTKVSMDARPHIPSSQPEVVPKIASESDSSSFTGNVEADINFADESIPGLVKDVGVASLESETLETLSPTTPADVSGVPVQQVFSELNEDPGDFSQFLEDLGLDVDDTPSSPPGETHPAADILSEEEKAAKEAEKKAKVAAKRKDIEERHTKWEEDLVREKTKQSKIIKDFVAATRTAAVPGLKSNQVIRHAIETLNEEAEKALRGVEAYLGKLKEGGKAPIEQASLWERVLSKVEKKFDERVEHVEVTVNKWYEDEVMSKERDEFQRGQKLVQATADDAQAILGLDYAWLEDVTVLDWKRYHKLEKDAKTWAEEITALLDGTAEDAYPNPVLDAFNDLHSEVSDITVGFQTRMRRIKREGERAFAANETPVNKIEGAKPEVSVLPIVNKKGRENGALEEVAEAILERSEKEIVDAIGRAEGRHEEL